MYSLYVYAPSGAFRHVLTAANGIDSVQWSVRADGDCMEARIVGVGLDIRPRDIVGIRCVERPTSDPATAVFRFWGWAYTAGSHRTNELTEWRLVGGSQRLKEIVNRRGRVTGGDVGAVARASLNEWPSASTGSPQLPVGVNLPAGGVFGNVGIEVGERIMYRETIADTLDALAAAAPAVDWDTPAVSWGVEAEAVTTPPNPPGGRLYFGRRTGSTTLDEYTERMDVEWSPSTADGVVDNVAVVFADRPSDEVRETHTPSLADNPYLPIGYELRDALAPAKYEAWKLVEYPTMDALTMMTWNTQVITTTGWVNPGNVWQLTTPTSYTSNARTGLATLIRRTPWRAAWLVRYSSFHPITFFVHQEVALGPWIDGQTRYSWLLGDTGGEQRDVLLVTPRKANDGGSQYQMGVQAIGDTLYNSAGDPQPLPGLIPEDSIRLYFIKPFAVNTEVLDRVARSHVRAPRENVAAMSIPNRILTPTPYLHLVLGAGAGFGGEELDVKAGSYEYAITRELGLTTVVRTSQELPADWQWQVDAGSPRVVVRPRPEARRVTP